MPRVEKFGIFYYVEAEKVAFGQKKAAFGQNKVAFERSISKIRINTPAKDKAPALIQMFRSAAREVTDMRKVAIDIAIDVAIASLFTLRLGMPYLSPGTDKRTVLSFLLKSSPDHKRDHNLIWSIWRRWS